MTTEDLQEMAKKVDAGKSMLARITILKERIAWLEEGRAIVVHFGSTTQHSPTGERIVLRDDNYRSLQESIKAQMKTELAELNRLLAEM